VLLNMDVSRARLGWMAPGSPVSLTVLDRDDPDLIDIDRLSSRYRGRPYHARDRPRMSAWITVDAWHGWGQPRTS